MLRWMGQRWKVVVPIGLALVALGTWLFFFWFGFHTVFFDRTVEEAAPTFTTTSLAPTTTTAASPDSGGTLVTTTTLPPTTTTTRVVGPVTLATGDFIDRSHPTSGAALVIGDGGSARVLRLAGFRTDNGPDLFVYLSSAPADAPAAEFDDDFVDLGTLKGNVGDQNYDIPPDVDLNRYTTVVIWCRRFAVAFGSADLAG